jgi:hypothetical protein
VTVKGQTGRKDEEQACLKKSSCRRSERHRKPSYALKWLKAQGDLVTKASRCSKSRPIRRPSNWKLLAGILTNVTAAEGDEVPVGSVIADPRRPRAPAAAVPTAVPAPGGLRFRGPESCCGRTRSYAPDRFEDASPPLTSKQPGRRPSPKARRIAAERGPIGDGGEVVLRVPLWKRRPRLGQAPRWKASRLRA